VIDLKGPWCNITVLNVHAPSEEKSDDSKHSFYMELEQVLDHFPKYTMKVLLGDFNAVVVRVIPTWTGPEGSWTLRLPDFKTVCHLPPPPPRYIPGTHFCKRLSRPQGHNVARRIMLMKNSNDSVRKRARHLPACSTLCQSTVPPHTPMQKWGERILFNRQLGMRNYIRKVMIMVLE
jgi:hypothetical protein